MSKIIKVFLLFCLLAGTVLTGPGCDWDPKAPSDKEKKDAVLRDKTITEFQDKLLDRAFGIATAIPVSPHVKSRSDAQALVIEACLQLDQPVRAQSYCSQIAIDNWKRGQSYAELADYCIERHHFDEVENCLIHVKEVLRKIEEKLEPDEISWRRDRLKSMIAQIQRKLSQGRQTGTRAVGPASLESSQDNFDDRLKTLDEVVEAGNFEDTKSALQAYADLFERFYKDDRRRNLAEERMKASWEKMPIFIRLDLLTALAQAGLDNADLKTALRLVNEAQHFLDDYQWSLEDYVPRMGQLAKSRFQAGDVEKARKDTDQAYHLFVSQDTEIPDTYRVEALLPLAEAYQVMGDVPTALLVYRRAVQESSKNPNSRPRAEALSAVCCSMALSTVQPDAELWEQIRLIHEGLGQPW